MILPGDANSGNILSIVKLCADAGDRGLKHLGDQPSQFISAPIQNELLFDLSAQVSATITNRIGMTPFSIIADETSDVSTSEQLCLAVRYLEYGNNTIVHPRIQERFLKFVKMKGVTGMFSFSLVSRVLPIACLCMCC